jgi:hypothetical protein
MIESVRPYMAYGDDSGKKDGGILTVGGWVAEAVEWETFGNAWHLVIRRLGLREFKRSGFDIRRLGDGPLLELSGIIHRRLSYGFACGIETDDWREIAKDYALELFHLVPYSICARTCIGFVRQWGVERNIRTDHIGYVFDKGSEGAGELTELLKIDASQDTRVTVAAVRGGDSEDYAGLQASDYLAWGIRTQFTKAGRDPEKWDADDITPEILGLLGAPLRYRVPKFGIYYARDLVKLCRDAKIPLKKDVPADVWAQKKPIRIWFPATKP